MTRPVTNPDAAAPSAPGALSAVGRVELGVVVVGGGDRQRGCGALQRASRHERGLHALGGEPDRAADGDELHRHGLAAGTYYYRVTAEDAAGNVGPASNEAAATVGDTQRAVARRGRLRRSGRSGRRRCPGRRRPTTSVCCATTSTAARSAGFTPSAGNRIAQPTHARLRRYDRARQLLLQGHRRGRGRQHRRRLERGRARRCAPTRPRRAHRAGLPARSPAAPSTSAGPPRTDDVGVTPLQRPPRHQRRLHAQRREPDRAADRAQLRRHRPRDRQLLLQGHRRGRRRQHQRRLERGQPPPSPTPPRPAAPARSPPPSPAARSTSAWGAATDNVGVSRYNLHRGTTSGFTPSAANRIAQPTGLSYADTGLAPGSYFYKLTAEDAAGNIGPVSNTASATVADTSPPSTPTTSPPPAAPARPASPGPPPPTTSPSPATTSTARPRTGFTPSTANRIAQPTATSYTDTGLAAGTYYYKLTAEDAAGNISPACNEATATVSAPPVTGLVAAYGFDTGTGTTITDQSGTGNNGTLTNATWAGTGRQVRQRAHLQRHQRHRHHPRHQLASTSPPA